MDRVELLDHGYIELVESWGSDERIIEAARMSTGKGFQGWGVEETCAKCGGSGTNEPENGPGSLCKVCVGRRVAINKPGDEKLLRYLYENSHVTPFEMAGMTIEVKAPIFVFREWHRPEEGLEEAHLQSFQIPILAVGDHGQLPPVGVGYNEMSARYTPLPDENYVPTVERVLLNSKTNKQAGTIKEAAELTASAAFDLLMEEEALHKRLEDFYQRKLKAGFPKELARTHLPVSRYSRMRATGNLRGWLAFLTLRMAPSAQWEIRQYANAVGQLVAKVFPHTWELFAERKP